MTTSKGNLNHGKLKPRQLEALAFYLGAHGVDPVPVLEEIEARFAQETSEEKQEPLRALHALEAKLQQVRKEKPEAEALWLRIRKELGDTPPPYFQAILMACFAIFALALDTLFLAPTMDILNIADPALQFLAAAGFAALCTAYFELTGLLYIGAERSLPKRLTALAAGGIGVVSLMVWGLLRGYQLRFAAVLAGNPLGQFLAAHSLLASVFYIFITLATPIIGATALLLDGRKCRAPGHGGGCGSGSKRSAQLKSSLLGRFKPSRNISTNSTNESRRNVSNGGPSSPSSMSADG